MAKRLVIVESPTKARTISKFLGKEFEVTASYGHIRDLPNNAAEIPEKLKKDKWTRLGVNVEKDFEPLYVIPQSKKDHVKTLKTALKNSDELLLATDEDREGESISWHIVELLKPKVPTKRLVFHEITKEAIQNSLDTARDIDKNLVKAQETRRIIDRLYGYSVSPVLWKKMGPRLSAGRVQSVAIRLLVERERERVKFKKAQYWDLKASYQKEDGTGSVFDAELSQVDGKRVAIGKDFDPNSGNLHPAADVVLLDENKAQALQQRLVTRPSTVKSVEEKPFTSKPAPPFTTSTMQQEASRKLRLPVRRTMQIAQMLYENGFITYMRTDSTALSDEAVQGAFNSIEGHFGKEFLLDQPRVYKTKVKNAQEAHEAIRPSGADFATPDDVKQKLGIEAFKLYELIWKRTLASQMKDAKGTRIAVQIECEEALFKASGKTIEFPGYLRAYVEGSDDPEAELADQEKILPKLEQGHTLLFKSLEALKHETQPPARYTEGSLIKELERRGIGRPSTWATIVDVVLQRTYAFKKGTALVPSFVAHGVIQLMEGHFASIVDYDFTARMEDDLDAISRGESDNLDYLRNFYFGNGLPGLKTLVQQGEEQIDPRIVCGLPIGKDPEGRLVEVRIGRYGPFLTNGEHRLSVPEMLAPDELNMDKAAQLLEEAARGPESLGDHPKTGEPIYVKTGRFGPYIQLGERGEGDEKPKMASLLPGMTPTDITFEQAVKILELPRNLGKHPENNEDVMAAAGRYGPYIVCGEETRSISMDEYSPIEITLEQAIEVLKQPKRGRRASAKPKQIKEIGKHPVSELNLTLRSGRFGPYVTDGTINASVPKGMDPETLTIDDAVNLMNARAAKLALQEAAGPAAGKKAAKKSSKKAAKKTAKKSAKKSAKKASKKSTAKKKSSAKKSKAKKKKAAKK